MINPYFKAKDFVLFHGDAIEILNQFDEEYFDLIFAYIHFLPITNWWFFYFVLFTNVTYS